MEGKRGRSLRCTCLSRALCQVLKSIGVADKSIHRESVTPYTWSSRSHSSNSLSACMGSMMAVRAAECNKSQHAR